MVPSRLVLVTALAAAPCLVAQDLRTIDPIPYGPTPTALHGEGAGAMWTTDWFAVDAAHPTGLGSYWAFENNVLDLGPMQSHGTAYGPTYSTDVPAAIAVWSTSSLALVAASQDHVDLDAHIASYSDLNHGTIAVWVKTTTSGALTILGASDSSDPSSEIALSLSNGRPWYDVRGDLNSWQVVSSAATINDGTWHHMCVVCEGNGVTTLYIDGVPLSTLHQGFFRYVFDIDKMSIGRNVDSGGPQWHFDGLMDDLAVWASPLSAAEVTQLATGAMSPLALAGTPVPVGPTVESGSLIHVGSLANGLTPYGNRIESRGPARAGRMFADRWDLTQNADYYLSCILRREDNNASIEPALLEMTDPGATRGMLGWDATGAWVVGGGTPTPGAAIMQPNTEYFCVLRISAVASGSDTAYLKVFDGSATIPIDDSGFSGVGLGANEWTASVAYVSGAIMDTLWLTPTGSNRIELDELRMGTSWESVVRGVYGSGCLSTQIAAIGRPVLGSAVTLQLSGGAANSFAAISMGLSATTSAFGPLPFDLGALGGPAGCFLLQSNDVSVPVLADGSGGASFVFNIANAAGLHGVTVLAQWASLDTALSAPVPVRTSPGLQLLVQN
ncbi:MAG: LamG domain-containing protein [Planctomycetes bacterium]|nr:LamG domain-containing protein [Planctomycetota bacterium]